MLPAVNLDDEPFLHADKIRDIRRNRILAPELESTEFTGPQTPPKYPLGVGLAASEMNWPALGKSVPFAVGIVVVLAGCLQFTAWKTRQLGLCRVSTICDRNLPTDSKSAVEYGLRLGVHCVFCCAGFMAILLVAGLMDLRVMAAVTVGITVERVVSRSGRFAFVTGVLAIVAGIVLMARAFGLS